MTDMKRRSFLQLLGVGAAATVAPVPLFASDDTSIWTPDRDLLAGHIVLTRPLAMRRPGGVNAVGYPVSGARFRWPQVKGQVFRAPETGSLAGQSATGAFIRRNATRPNYRQTGPDGVEVVDYGHLNPVDLPMVDSFGEEPHIDVVHTAKTSATLGYYKASMQLRERFKEESLSMLNQLPEWERPGVKIVTLVNTPIFVGALDDAYWRDYNNPGEDRPEGFRVSMDYVQYLVRGSLDYNGWAEYSTTGEYPIEPPSHVDWDHIYALDKKFVEGNRETRPVPKGTSLLILS